MKRIMGLMLVAAFTFGMIGCDKKQVAAWTTAAFGAGFLTASLIVQTTCYDNTGAEISCDSLVD